jgi:WD40 repeat protein
MLTVVFSLNQPNLNASSSQGKAFPEIIQLPTGFAPEGIATGKGTSFFVGSLSGGAIYKGDLRTGEGDILVPDMEGDIAVGLDVDVRSNNLFVCGGRNGDARVYNAETGEPRASYTLSTAENAFVNDVIITRDAAYFTNSFESVIYKLPLGPGGELPSEDDIETLELSDNYNTVDGFNTNGIEATSNGKQLIIVNSSTGELYTVNPMNGMAKQIDLGGENVQTGDGILLDGKTLYVVQNRRNQIAVVDLNNDLSEGEITETITHSAFAVPTTVAQHGNSLYAVNAKFGTDSEGTPYEVVKVSK